MSDDRVRNFLMHGTRTGKIAWVASNGAPHVAPIWFVKIDGTVTLDDDPDVVRRFATIIGGRYMGTDRAQEFGERNGVPGQWLVRLHPSKVTAAFGVAD